MENCKFEKKLVDYLNGDLPESSHAEMEQHLRACQICSDQLQEMKTIHSMLLERRRPEPTLDLANQYDQELNELFEPKLRFKKIKARFDTIRDLFNNVSPIGIRLAGAVAILVIGIFIGKMILKPAQKSEQLMIEPMIVNLLENQSELKIMKEKVIALSGTHNPDEQPSDEVKTMPEKKKSKKSLTPDDIARMIKEWDDKTTGEWAEEFGVSYQTILKMAEAIRKEDKTLCPKKPKKARTRADMAKAGIALFKKKQK